MTTPNATEMVERIARGLAAEAAGRAWMFDPNFMSMKYPDGQGAYANENWPKYVDSARAALEAMREPSDAVSETINRFVNWEPGYRIGPQNLMNHIVTAALQEGER